MRGKFPLIIQTGKYTEGGGWGGGLSSSHTSTITLAYQWAYPIEEE
jgi:hypothetical protein